MIALVTTQGPRLSGGGLSFLLGGDLVKEFGAGLLLLLQTELRGPSAEDRPHCKQIKVLEQIWWGPKSTSGTFCLVE